MHELLKRAIQDEIQQKMESDVAAFYSRIGDMSPDKVIAGHAPQPGASRRYRTQAEGKGP
jgi:hypothetical protein